MKNKNLESKETTINNEVVINAMKELKQWMVENKVNYLSIALFNPSNNWLIATYTLEGSLKYDEKGDLIGDYYKEIAFKEGSEKDEKD